MGELGTVKRDRISVVIPLFNSEDWVRQTLLSVCEQDLPPFEIIVIDDGSTDRSCEIVNQVAKEFPKIAITIHSIVNSGVSAARNLGISLCSGDLVALLDSDDVWLPAKLRIQYSYLIANPKCVAVLTDFFISIPKMNGELRNLRVISKKGVRDIGLNWLSLRGNGALLSSTILFWRLPVAKKITFHEHLSTAADLSYYFQLTQINSVGHIFIPLTQYRQHGKQMHTNPDLLKNDFRFLLDELVVSGVEFSRRRILGNVYVMSALLNLSKGRFRVASRDAFSGLIHWPSSLVLIPFAIVAKRVKGYFTLKAVTPR